MTVAFAALAGSFIARNTDLWLHLAAGRLIAGGEYAFGVDPFSSSTAGRYWANHAWLFDLGLYFLFQSLGGQALVAVKAALVAGSAGVMLLIARHRASTWLAAGCVLLAVLAMTPRLLLQPTIVSYLLLPACVYCLHRGGRALVAVPILIALWANLDSWFLLGPLVVVLFWIGRRIDPERISLPPWPSWLVPVSIVACLLSPHHVFAFTLPVELSPAVWASAIPSDPRFAVYFTSPWQTGQLGSSGGYSLAAWAFFALMGLGILSFAFNPRAARSWRGPLWLTFALLAAWQARLIPFFAVVAGPITALNMGEVIPGNALHRSGRAVVLVAAVALLGVGWMGWTVGFHNRERAAAWGIHTDPTLERAAVGVARWRAENHIPPNTPILTTHPDLGHYLAWFAPGEKSTIDSRFALFPDSYSIYANQSRVLGLLSDKDSAPFDASDARRGRSIAAVCVYDPDPRRMTSALQTIVQHDSPSWRIARVDGGAVLLVPAASHSRGRSFDAERMVFGSPAPEDVPPAGNGPGRLAEPTLFWFLNRSTGRSGSWEADAATIYVRLFEDRAGREDDRPPLLPGLLGRRAAETMWAYHSPARSPALLLLAIRATRRGVEIDPSDPTAWFMLGRAYELLEERTWEGDASEHLTLLGQIRRVQTTTAFVQAAILNPDLSPARLALARAYLNHGAIDLAHRHALQALRIIRRSGPAAGETRGGYDARVASMTEWTGRLEAAVLDGENRYLVRTAGLAGEPLTRARVARELGLRQKAINVLIESHPDLYGPEGVGLLIELLIETGQIPEARALLEREEIQRNPGSLGVSQVMGRTHPGGHQWAYHFPRYAWLSLSLAIGAGQYDRARTLIDDLCEVYEQEDRALAPVRTIELGQALAGEVGLAATSNAAFNRFWAAQATEIQSSHWRHTRLLSVHRADLLTLSGVLELERGNRAGARDRLRAAGGLYELNRAGAPALPGLALANRYLEAIRYYP